jgi:flagellar biosynthesis/type III secretory pathway M-ring protein FliF/YscJ
MAAGATNGTPPVFMNRTFQIIAGVVFLIIIITIGILVAVNASKSLGNYRDLVRGIDQSRALEIAAQLKSAGIETELIPTDTGGVAVQVREKQFDAAVLELAKSDLLLTDDFKLFDKTDWAASDYEKRVKYMRAVGGELSRLVSRMDGIRWAKVHVTIPPDKVFASRYEKDKTSASVTIELEPGRTLNRSQVSSIISLVSGYVPEIEPNRISIIDTKGRVYSSASGGDSDGAMTGGGFDVAGQTQAVNSVIESRIQSYLDGVVGPGKAQAAVSTLLSTEKETRNKTTFFPGAIGTHEYSEEALGDAAATPAYNGTGQFTPPPRPVGSYYQSQGTDMVDPRLQKDMPGNLPAGSNQAFAAPTQDVPQVGSIGIMPGKNGNYPDPSKQPSPYESGGLYNMGSNPIGGASGGSTNPNDPTRFVCAANDEACKRNYRRHNFSIHSYPSYEQVMTESPAGAVRGIKVSVVVEKGSLPVSINQLKEGVAAAADPSMSPADVQVILRPTINVSEKTTPKNKVTLGRNEDGSWPWWMILLAIPIFLIVAFIVWQLVAGFLGLILKGKPKNFREEPLFPPRPSPSPLDRLDLGRRPQQTPYENTAPPQPAPPAPTTNTPLPNFEDVPSTPRKAQPDLPFDLDDELAIEDKPQVTTPRRPAPKQRPKVVIEDE